jgi:UDP-N-acetylglucosamine--N-acetylmuramyl-(pentapeptide) pyrophosphoryl-undecaprenol N-acetylglucosamine transferase
MLLMNKIETNDMKVIISGGGTGGHIFPALSIAEVLKKRFPNVEILFVGAENRMEMEKIPAAGYPIVGLPVAGFDRKNLLRNIGVLIKLRESLRLAKKTLKDFHPDIAIGVGGYASGPTLKMASKLGIPTLIQEQNSYAGVTNKLLAKKASKICVAYDGMERFFPKEKIVLTGNPVRQNLLAKVEDKLAAYSFFGLDPEKKTILVVGGSLGARTINNSIIGGIDKLVDSNIQVLWQSGKIYHETLKKKLSEKSNPANIHLCDFISRMDLAYVVADLVVSRAGAGAISELCLLGKATILVPSPNVAEDHQTKNALALVNKEAAILVKDVEAEQKLVDEALKEVQNTTLLEKLSANIGKLALPNSAEHIVDEIVKIVEANKR